MSRFEAQAIEKMQVILTLLEETLNSKGGYEVKTCDITGEKKSVTYSREEYLAAGIEASIVGIYDLITCFEERKKIKKELRVISTKTK